MREISQPVPGPSPAITKVFDPDDSKSVWPKELSSGAGSPQIQERSLGPARQFDAEGNVSISPKPGADEGYEVHHVKMPPGKQSVVTGGGSPNFLARGYDDVPRIGGHLGPEHSLGQEEFFVTQSKQPKRFDRPLDQARQQWLPDDVLASMGGRVTKSGHLSSMHDQGRSWSGSTPMDIQGTRGAKAATFTEDQLARQQQVKAVKEALKDNTEFKHMSHAEIRQLALDRKQTLNAPERKKITDNRTKVSDAIVTPTGTQFRTPHAFMNHLIFSLLLGTGARLGVLSELRWGDIKVGTNTIAGARKGKDGKFHLTANKTLLEDLQSWKEHRISIEQRGTGPRYRNPAFTDNDYVFIATGTEGNPVPKYQQMIQGEAAPEKMVNKVIGQRLNDYVAPLIGRQIRPHMLRGTLVDMLHKAGFDVEQIAARLDHESAETTNRYYLTKRGYEQQGPGDVTLQKTAVGGSPEERQIVEGHANRQDRRFDPAMPVTGPMHDRLTTPALTPADHSVLKETPNLLEEVNTRPHVMEAETYLQSQLPTTRTTYDFEDELETILYTQKGAMVAGVARQTPTIQALVKSTSSPKQLIKFLETASPAEMQEITDGLKVLFHQTENMDAVLRQVDPDALKMTMGYLLAERRAMKLGARVMEKFYAMRSHGGHAGVLFEKAKRGPKKGTYRRRLDEHHEEVQAIAEPRGFSKDPTVMHGRGQDIPQIFGPDMADKKEQILSRTVGRDGFIDLMKERARGKFKGGERKPSLSDQITDALKAGDPDKKIRHLLQATNQHGSRTLAVKKLFSIISLMALPTFVSQEA
tara:strand:- start:2452 stop:4878 length:2427 start_codon:yes stop_codon:yes gene_type:complete